MIVVSSPDPDYFEEAIFIVKDESKLKEGVTKDKLLAEACRAAEGMAGGGKRRYSMPMFLAVSMSLLCGTGISFAILKLIGA